MRYVFVLFFVLFALQAFAEELKPFSQMGSNYALVERIKSFAESNITEAKGSDGKNLEALTSDEKLNGVIPLTDVRRVIDRGVYTAYAYFCGIAWEEKSFLPFMKAERESGKWSDRQIAFIGFLHGTTMGLFQKELMDGEICSLDIRQSVNRYAAKIEKASE